MGYTAIAWLAFNILTIIVLAFYSMLEMACVSFNKVRLQYYVSKGYRRAIWLNYLLQHPARLFGTTLIGVNIALVIGSECSREFYSALGLSPDLSPLTQVILVVIFGELAPMFAARRYPEHVAMLGIPLIYASARLMTPLLFILDWISKRVTYLFGGKQGEPNLYLSQEELQKILEEQSDEPTSVSESDEFSAITSNIFSLRSKNALQIMEPLATESSLPANATIADVEKLLTAINVNFVPIYHHELSNIVGIIYPRDIMRAPETRKIRDYARPPWFLTEGTSLMQILKQFRTNSENVAVILNRFGKAVGIVTLDSVLEELFGNASYSERQSAKGHLKNLMLIEKSFPGNMTVGELYQQYGFLIDQNTHLSLSALIAHQLGHHPEKGETIFVAPFELTVKETTLMDVKTVSISTRSL